MTDENPVYRAAADEADHRLAHELAEAAGKLLVELRVPGGGRELSDAGDRRSDDFLLGRLAERRPADAVLSEESADDPARLTASRVWIVDPLDGSREYGEAGRDDWAVHVALWVDGSLAAGAVAVPALGVTYSTWRVVELGPEPAEPVLLASRSRPPALLAGVAERVGGRIEPMGSAGAKTAAVLRGQGSAYVHGGGQYEWDSAAPVAVAVAHGCAVRRLDGSAPRYNRPDPALPDIVICRPALDGPLWTELDRAAE